MVGSIVEEGGVGFGEDASTPSVALGEDDLVEKFDGRVLRPCRFTLVNKLVERCNCQHADIGIDELDNTP